jgi:hypothetical protein
MWQPREGGTTKQKALVVWNDDIAVPHELKAQSQNLTFYMDSMFVNEMPMMTGVDDTVHHRACVSLKNRQASKLI